MYEYHATVERVLDGDTVDLSIDLGFCICWKTRARLYGINSPEIHSTNGIEKTAGLLAQKFLTDLIGGKLVRIQTQLDKGDKFGRVLATIWLLDAGLQTESVNDQMIKAKQALPYFGEKKPLFTPII